MTPSEPVPPAEPLTPSEPVPPAEPLSPVSRTALSVARVRAYESSRPDPLFVDPYAAAFVEAAGLPLPTSGSGGDLAKALVAHGILRTRFYDDRLLAAGADQVVLLAAGLDTRAYRLDWPAGTRVFELDLGPVLAFKEQVLDGIGARPRSGRTTLPADLLDPDWPARLVAAGFDPSRPSAWLAEGLLVYLSPEEAAGLLTAVAGLAAPGSRLLTEKGGDVAATPQDPALAHITDLWRGGLGPDTHGWLDRHGWTTGLTALDRVGATYGRPLSRPSTRGFIEAVRRTGD
ncbi:S-adenosyl-L-methionine-dependent methyltransferase [Kitasatospora xanthocidica]|uniref:SAM-dependent methyltransferase n=1 Tax=Kitasatospora xanthocidica TaxID=83382 RepID=UPI00167B8587|nr:SAM-dependent methyltransferase [Kitasatospora xanthocidica]GHF85555.1 S-adenosyl-L-methionine-dependent methyltransferase [Kitasatospora xanthocidica]